MYDVRAWNRSSHERLADEGRLLANLATQVEHVIRCYSKVGFSCFSRCGVTEV